MKLTQEQLKELLNKLGVQDVELVEDGETSDFDIDSALQAVDDNRTPFIKDKISGNLKSEMAGNFGGILRSALSKASGIGRSQLDSIREDSEAVKAAFKFYEESLEKKPSETKAEIDALIAAHEAEMQKIKGDYEVQLSEANSKYINRDINDYLYSVVEKLPNLSPKADKKELVDVLRYKLEKNVDLSYDAEKGQVIALKKGTKSPAMNAAGTQLTNIADEAISAFTPLGGVFIEEKVEDTPISVADDIGQPYNPQRTEKKPIVGGMTGSLVEQLNAQRKAAFQEAQQA